LCLTDATVSWIKGNVFAVRFSKLADDAQKRIQGVVLKHVSLSDGKNQRTAFRIVV